MKLVDELLADGRDHGSCEPANDNALRPSRAQDILTTEPLLVAAVPTAEPPELSSSVEVARLIEDHARHRLAPIGPAREAVEHRLMAGGIQSGAFSRPGGDSR